MRTLSAVTTRIIVLLVVLVTATGCSIIAHFFVSSSRETFTFDGMTRAYRLYKPKGMPTPTPLVVVLHALASIFRAAVTRGVKLVLASLWADGAGWV